MADYHILQASKNGNVLAVIMHIPIPDTTNLVGTSYHAILAQLQATLESAVPSISSEELNSLRAGELVEAPYRFCTHPAESLSQKRDRLDAVYGTIVGRVQAEWQQRLSCYGYEREVS